MGKAKDDEIKKLNEAILAKDEEIKVLKETILEKNAEILEKDNEKKLLDLLIEIENDEIEQYQAFLIKKEKVITAICTSLNLKQDEVPKIDESLEDLRINISQWQ